VLGTRLFLFRSLEREESELELELESLKESEDEDDSEDEDESEESESESRLAFFLDFSLPFPLSFSLSFSLASKIRFAVPVLVLNSSGTSTDGLPSTLSFANTPGFRAVEFGTDGIHMGGWLCIHR